MQVHGSSRAAAGSFSSSRCARPAAAPGSRRLTVAAAGGGDRVVCVGEALFDFLANEKGLKREEVKSWPTNILPAYNFLANEKGLKREEVKSWTPYPGGAPANVATALTKLGVPTAFVSALGNDERGEELMALLKEIGVDTSTVQRVDAPTRDIYVERTLDGDRVFAGFGLESHKYCDCALDAEKLPKDILSGADFMVTGTLGLASPKTRAAMKAAAQLVKVGGGKVLVDVNWRPVFWADNGEAKREILEFLNMADIVKISDADLEFLYDMQFVTALLNPCSVADRLPNAPAVLVTAGEEGAAYCCRSTKGEHTGFVPVFKVDVADTTGAGDAFTAGFVYKLLEAGGLDRLLSDPKALKEAVVFAAATGALTCTKPGAIAAQPSLQQVQALFEESKGWYNFWGAEAEASRR
uniref:Carbohydrate kinase PfkB domain-containing protein n=1 Tax=Tetradesmus obliquus TaxID=3088 RepID=A0A383WKL7_TETOB